ncbi:hypothetical protein Noc_1538 [Nitrosococcus oceani ATCC 19707]|uniref:Uncharacterized protein n=2 Tax=Nitrosococcus oceani TaxID=1229 RepID=Q3JAX4_NITOC|nr:hypothetical protein [Nitrosococcus oceani]ABA58022.1 hypothetical protein Noc_1538 [Nitrosococcus oceani ATCC 19707]EDZ67132.1 hypothetical protein NOC27_459 [Nitrosococcus oceani AFC27]KFI19545.1 hypothetical protein IB75_08085 [Nitrosococcus oceani C-27]
MRLFRHLRLRQIMVGIFLLMGLGTQSQEIFACSLMDDKPRFVCCCGQPVTDSCEMEGGCGASESHTGTDCCQVSVVQLAGLHAPSPASSQLLAMLLDGPQPPPAILPPATFVVALPRPLLTAPPIPPFSSGFPGTRTYLFTHRLRN